MKRGLRGYRLAALVGTLLFAFMLGWVVLEGDTQGVAWESLADRYLADGVDDTGAVNIVSAVLLDYRAFDTQIEATVIFAAAVVIGLLLTGARHPFPGASLSPLVQCALGYLAPLFWIFPVSIILRGHVSPGGGFQGGVALAVLLILARIVHGDDAAGRGAGTPLLAGGEVAGILLIMVLGGVGMIAGGPYLSNLASGYRAGVPGTLPSAGFMLFMNIAIGCKVAAALTLIHRRLQIGPGEPA